MVAACRYARENNIPYFGICLGLHISVIEFARNVLGIECATSEEFAEEGQEGIYVIVKMRDQRNMEMRLGNQECDLEAGSMVREIYGKDTVIERYRHKYVMNTQYVSHIQLNGMKVTGYAAGTHLAQIVEVPANNFFIAVQFHPEFISKPLVPHPIFTAFVRRSAGRAMVANE